MKKKRTFISFFYIDILKYKDVGIFCTKQIDEPCAIYIHIYYIHTGLTELDDSVNSNL